MSVQSVASTAALPVNTQSQKTTPVSASQPATTSNSDGPAVVVSISPSTAKPISASVQLQSTASAENAMIAIYNQTDWSRIGAGLTADQIATAQAHNAKQFADEEADTIQFASSAGLSSSNIAFTPISNFASVYNKSASALSTTANDTSIDKPIVQTKSSLVVPSAGTDGTSVAGLGGGAKTSVTQGEVTQSTGGISLSDKPAGADVRPDAQAAAALAVLQAAAATADDESQAKTDLYV